MMSHNPVLLSGEVHMMSPNPVLLSGEGDKGSAHRNSQSQDIFRHI